MKGKYHCNDSSFMLVVIYESYLQIRRTHEESKSHGKLHPVNFLCNFERFLQNLHTPNSRRLIMTRYRSKIQSRFLLIVISEHQIEFN